jgi:hypothetical protein
MVATQSLLLTLIASFAAAVRLIVHCGYVFLLEDDDVLAGLQLVEADPL